MTSPPLPFGAGAVMESRAHGEVEGDDALTALYRRLEFFPTPPWAARAGGELIELLDPARGPRLRSIWEPACGQGHMVHGLAPYCGQIVCSDIHEHDVSKVRAHWLGALDFAAGEPHRFDGGVDFVATNPPFPAAAEFVRQGLKRARRGVAILARASFRESAGRADLFARPEYAGRASFIERVPMLLGRYDPKASTATAYAWFVWLKPDIDTAQTRLVGEIKRAFGPAAGLDLEIPAGTRARLTKPSDARLWATAAAAGGLLDGGGE